MQRKVLTKLIFWKKKYWYKEISKIKKNLEKYQKEVTPSLNEEKIMEKIETEFDENSLIAKKYFLNSF